MPTNTYVALDKKTATTSIANAEFTSIPQGYTDLVVIVAGQVSSNVSLAFQVNGDTGSNYSCTEIFGDGTTASSFSSTNNAQVTVASIGAQINSGTPWVSTLHFQNYSNTTTNKTILGRTSAAGTGVNAIVGLYRSTSAITSIKIMGFNNASGFTTGTTFSLYGIAAEGVTPAAKATGGDIYSDSTYYYHVFDSTGVFTPSTSLTASVLVVGTGGVGGVFSGGGGAGGSIGYNGSVSLASATSYTATIGASGVVPKVNSSGSKVQNATASTNCTFSGGAISTITGTAGGNGTDNGAGGSNLSFSGGTGSGGGGAGFGANGSAGAGGAGGNGVSTYSSWGEATGIGQNINGTYWFAGGGGGSTGSGASAGAGGNGGGGAGGSDGFSGVAYTGGGGGGAKNSPNYGDGGAGGLGVVIVRYLKA